MWHAHLLTSWQCLHARGPVCFTVISTFSERLRIGTPVGASRRNTLVLARWHFHVSRPRTPLPSHSTSNKFIDRDINIQNDQWPLSTRSEPTASPVLFGHWNVIAGKRQWLRPPSMRNKPSVCLVGGCRTWRKPTSGVGTPVYRLSSSGAVLRGYPYPYSSHELS